jgi:hypothetical protein
MKLVKFLTILAFLSTSLFTYGQTVSFVYDSNGNRTKRSIIVEELQEKSFTFPVKTESLNIGSKGSDSDKSEVLEIAGHLIASEEGEEVKTIIYPNPTRGLLKIEVINLPFASTTEMRLFDLEGKVLKTLKNFDSVSEMDIGNLRNGLYILRIEINDLVFDWKVIKTSY